jgi:SAM-dependent methyltransferase
MESEIIPTSEFSHTLDPYWTLGVQANSLSILVETKRMMTPMDQDVSEDLVEAGRGYESLFVPALFQAWTKHLVEGAEIQEGSHVLDVACGTGVLARNAFARTGANGRVVGADPAPGMLAAANEIEPAIDWVLCSAEALDVDDGSFDCVISQFGMMFFKDRQKSAEEMFRALKPGGSLAIAVWRSVEHNPAYADIISVLEEQVGTAAANALRLPYSLGNSDEVTAVLEGGGFADITVEAKTETATFPSSRQMVEAELRGWLPLFDIFLSEDKINEVLIESDKTLGKYAGPSGEAVFPSSAHLFTARKI